MIKAHPISPEPVNKANAVNTVNTVNTVNKSEPASKPARDRTAYFREYMRRRRSKLKTGELK